MDSPTRFRRWVEPVVIGLITMAVAGLFLASGQFFFRGGVVEFLGGMSEAEIGILLNSKLSNIQFRSDCILYEAGQSCGEAQRKAPACPKDYSPVTRYDDSWGGGKECDYLERCSLCVRLSRQDSPIRESE